MKTVIFLGKRLAAGSPRAQYPGADLWGVTQSQQRYEKFGPIEDWTAWYDLHPVEPTAFYPGIRLARPRTYEWYIRLPANDRPLYLLEHDRRIPASVPFPYRELASRFPILDEARGMWTCQVDWMFAHALSLGFQHIVLAGHGVSQEPNHMIAHRGIMYWVGFARGRGVRVTVQAPSWYRAPDKAYGLEAGAWQPPGVAPPRRNVQPKSARAHAFNPGPRRAAFAGRR